MQWSQPLNDVDDQPLEHLANHLIGALNEYLNWPPRLLRHVLEEPLACFLAGVELFCQELNPENHCRLEQKVMLMDGLERHVNVAYLFLSVNECLHEERNRKLSCPECDVVEYHERLRNVAADLPHETRRKSLIFMNSKHTRSSYLKYVCSKMLRSSK